MVKLLLIILANILFVGNYSISCLVYPGPWISDSYLESWWVLKTNIYAVTFGILGYGFVLKSPPKYDKWIRFFVSLFTGFCISDIVDRLFFDTRYFHRDDYIMIVFTFGIALYYLIKEWKCRIRK